MLYLDTVFEFSSQSSMLLYLGYAIDRHTRTQVLKQVKDEKKLVWIAKALILRGHRYANIIINKVLKDVKEEVKNQRVQILAENPPFAMTRASGARVKVTWRQRLFCTLWNERLCEDESLVILARWTPISVRSVRARSARIFNQSYPSKTTSITVSLTHIVCVAL